MNDDLPTDRAAKASEEPLTGAPTPEGVRIEGGEVDLTLTPRAALQTAKNIGDAAVEKLIEGTPAAKPAQGSGNGA